MPKIGGPSVGVTSGSVGGLCHDGEADQQKTDTKQIPGSAPDWPKANTSSAAANRRRLSTASPQLMSPVARRLSDPSVGESQLILVSVILKGRRTAR